MSLRVLPLGGCGEVGLNATLLLDGEDALLIDCGVLLGIPNAPGVERAVPGFEALRVPGRKLHGVVLTHGHEDHIGALPALLAEMDVAVFGSPLAITLARTRLEGTRGGSFVIAKEARRQAKGLVPVPLGGKVNVGPFHVELIRVTHSLPDSAALYIETRSGRVLHSGDFKLDPDPHDGRTTDLERLRALGAQGIDLLLADSTNSEVPGRHKSEREVGSQIDHLIGGSGGRVVVACLASHLHRLDGILRAARRHGRRVALVGRALHDMLRIGIDAGHLDVDESLLVSEERIAYVPRRDLVVITTGSQGEPTAGLARVAGGKDEHLRCAVGDRVIISARTIPGNEQAVRKVINSLARQGIEVLTDRMLPVHCSGHASMEEQAELIRLARPRSFVPVHGERAMLEAHVRTAVREGVAPERALVIEDGESVVLEGGRLARGATEAVSRRAIDGEGRALDWGDVKDRLRISRAGLVVCSVALARGTHRMLQRPQLTARGLTLSSGLVARLESAVAEALAEASTEPEVQIKTAIRNVLKNEGAGTPEIAAHVLSIDRS